MYKLFLFIILLALATTQVFASDYCEAPLSKKEWQAFLGPDSFDADIPTVVFDRIENTNQIVLLKKDPHKPWTSTFKYIQDTFTPQGDPRVPFLFFGSTLASKLAFKLEFKPDNSVELWAPSTALYKQRLMKINEALLAMKAEPIAYLPIDTGYAEPRQIIDLAMHFEDGFSFHFPFAEKDPQLVVHEVAFHTGAILFPKEYFDRANQINQDTVDFIDYLMTSDALPQELIHKITTQLLIERSYELDAGTANVVSTLSSLRSQLDMLRYRTIMKLIHNRVKFHQEVIHRGVEFLVRPQLRPLEALFLRLSSMTDISLEGLVEGKKSFRQDISSTEEGYGRKIALTPAEKEQLKKIAIEFKNSYPENFEHAYEISSAEESAKKMILGLDDRIAQILKACRKAGL